ncbi:MULTISPECIES: ABC transporter ATP-binding protein [Rhizobium/Agrobacterium group]|uniref:ABC transporter ATP-binding protein n=2 Tax=Neorhizobium TaxID=1525371 RepID=A0ABV0MAE0_9HYPH|nr:MULTISPECIES: ABC transporter ATP-binding protein [Rhizobium/Agrobacterium group]KGE02217.1 ABC transporter [Rhizobium sp. YS-1r]MCC2614127.1 ABC transporter ATP-binding protein [Neorhizobium petrolearium]WGI71642.1 ABC transporter ATP-binding protein [Neorhizobium petrolearium]
MQISIRNFTKKFDDTPVIENMNLTVNGGEMLALLGPSGCGKSTTLFAICGIHRIDGGQILFGDRDVSTLPSQKRNVGVVFQNYALYPHMTVYENIAFPLTVRNDRKADIDKEVRAIAKLTHISELLERRPGQLSGGQQQRVALARALIRRPDVLLLDEPLANLDAKLRLEMRSEIRRIQLETGITAVLVTHDQVEAMSMCDRIAIMKAGEIVQIATPSEMYNDPRTAFVAGFLGNPPISFLKGRVQQGAFALDDGGLKLPLAALSGIPDGTALTLGIRPEHFGIAGDVPIEGKVTFAETQGRENLYDVVLPDGSVLRSIQPARNDVRPGDSVRWSLDSKAALVFAEDGRRL